MLSKLAFRYQLLDMPDERKVHTQPIPRIGGIAMAIGALLPIFYWVSEDRMVLSYLAGAAVIVGFGLLDDISGLSPVGKLAGQIIAALLVIFWGGIKITYLGMLLPEGVVLPEVVALPITVLAIVGVTNAINLADGLDGLAGGISLLSLACIGFLAYLEGDFSVGLVSLSLCGAVFGFLRHNTFPATIFMGDTGSQFLGYSAITMALALTQGSTPLSPLLPLIILGFPVLDTLTVMTSRVIRGKSPFLADKAHFHHSLLGLGLHQTESVLAIYLIQTFLILSAYRFRFYSDWLLLLAYIGFSVTVLIIFSQSNRYHWQPKRLALIVKIKGFLGWLRDDTDTIKYLFGALKVGMPVILLLTVLLANPLGTYLKIAALITATVLLLIMRFFRNGLDDWLRTILYLLIPISIYHSDIVVSNFSSMTFRIYNSAFIILAILNILVSKLTKRKIGFKSTPLDFLILFIVLAIPNIQQTNLHDFRLGLVAAKIIIMYFSCEILFAELRGNYRGMTKVTLIALVGLAIRY
ncbi:MraY family glycosyltransferase [Geobacter sp. OR-1]|uniref:MraY family glycosyltransferase n=1 Tax=Geobacter sp. OR-1 TaxID=1266765 RepID=UPI001ED98CDA|nr:MraY family glycosyltransferase [Geobacter sp. OR-1]